MKRISLALMSLMLFLLSGVAYGQSRTVTGTVIGEDDGLALPQVSIFIKGTTQGTSTDFDGKYSIEVPSGESVLVYRFLGYVIKEVTVGNQTVINVSLTPDATTLGEVVVTGYGVERKREITGELLDRGEEDTVPLDIMMTEVLLGMDLVEADLQAAAVEEEEGLPEDLEAEHQEVQEVELQAVPEVVLQEVLEEEHLRTGEEVTGGRPEDITEMLLRCMMSEHVYIVSSCNCYNYISSK